MKNIIENHYRKISLFMLLIFAGCMPDSLTKWEQTPEKKEAQSTTSSTTTTTSDTVSVTNLQYFQLSNITASPTTYYMHRYGAANSEEPCRILNTNLGNGDSLLLDDDGYPTTFNDTLCWMEAEEMQLYLNGAKLRVDVNAGLCDYVRITPFFFWRHQPGATQLSLQEYICPTDIAGVAALVPQCTTSPKLPDSAKKCLFDYSDEDDAGPNCDTGSISITTYTVSCQDTDDPVDGIANVCTTTAAPLVETKCGGKTNSCLAGPALDYSTNKNGAPTSKYYTASSGLSQSITIDSPFAKGLTTNKYISNYTDEFGTASTTYDMSVANSTTGLYVYSQADTGSTVLCTDASANTQFGYVDGNCVGVNAATAGTLDPLKDGINPFYTFECLDFASEVKGRIRLQIRDWNQRFTSNNAAGFVNTIDGNDGSNDRLRRMSSTSTSYETSGIDYWNDVLDWDTYYYYGDRGAAIDVADPVTAPNFGFSVFNGVLSSTECGYPFPGYAPMAPTADCSGGDTLYGSRSNTGY